MKRKKYKDYIWFVAVAVFLICVAEGIMYYHETESLFLKVTLNIQNIIKAYKIDPDIKQKEAMAFWMNSNYGVWAGVLTYMYCAAVVVAPFCTIAALLTLLEKPWAYITGLLKRKNKKRVLVIGEGKYFDKFVKSLSQDCRVTAVVKDPSSDNTLLDYYKRGITLVKQYEDSRKDFWTKKELQKYDDILFCDENPIKNLQNLNLLLNSECTKKTAKTADHKSIPVYVCCNDASLSEIIRQYEAEHKNEMFIVNIVDVKQLSVNRMFLKNPIYTVNKGSNCDVHMGILGFGEFGQNVLIQGLNTAVLSPDSTIRIDVFDNDMSSILGSFLKRFSTDILDGLKLDMKNVFDGGNVKCYTLKLPVRPENNAGYRLFDIDGKIELNFWEIDATTILFSKALRMCNEIIPFTYMVVAMKDTHSMSLAAIEIMALFHANGNAKDSCSKNVPIIIQNKDNVSLDMIAGKKIVTIDQNEDIFSYSSLTGDEITKNAKAFNCKYHQIISGKEHVDPESVWPGNMYNRESSIAQSLHQNVKEWLLFNDEGPKYYPVDEQDKEKKELLQKIEHRRWTLYMILHGYRYSGASKKDDMAKTHSCISTWENLKQERPDTLEYDFIPYILAMKRASNHQDIPEK